MSSERISRLLTVLLRQQLIDRRLLSVAFRLNELGDELELP
jgi:hypothetical protein